jgi:hypothetical protein
MKQRKKFELNGKQFDKNPVPVADLLWFTDRTPFWQSAHAYALSVVTTLTNCGRRVYCLIVFAEDVNSESPIEYIRNSF